MRQRIGDLLASAQDWDTRANQLINDKNTDSVNYLTRLQQLAEQSNNLHVELKLRETLKQLYRSFPAISTRAEEDHSQPQHFSNPSQDRSAVPTPAELIQTI